MRFLFLIGFFFLIQFGAGPKAAAATSFADDICEEMLAPYRSQLSDKIRQIDIYLSEKVFNLRGFKPVEVLGLGFSGHVLRIVKGDRNYAIKTFNHEWPTQPTSTQDHLDFRSEVRSAVAMQDVLGQLGLAPKVIGVVPAKKIQAWLKTNESAITHFGLREDDTLKSNARFGLVMEVVDGVPLKHKSDVTIRLTKSQCRQLRRRAIDITRQLKALRLGTHDPDAVVTAEGDIVLIDISFYNRGTVERINREGNLWLWEMIEERREKGGILCL